MNRIVLIGNGFDLAHGLPTRYEDFINWYWEKRVDSFTGNLTSISEDYLCSIKITSDNYNRCWNVFAFCLPKFFNKPSGKEIIDSIANDSKSFELSLSPFFLIYALVLRPKILNLLSFRCLRFLRIYVFVLKLKGGLT